VSPNTTSDEKSQQTPINGKKNKLKSDRQDGNARLQIPASPVNECIVYLEMDADEPGPTVDSPVSTAA
jgi:hypothetical protein